MGSACVSVPGLVLVRPQAPSSLLSGARWEQTLARRTLDVIDIVEILIHWYAGRSQNELATGLGVDRKTLRKYTAPAEVEPDRPGGLGQQHPTGLRHDLRPGRVHGRTRVQPSTLAHL